MAQYPGFIGGSYQAQAVTADQEQTINWYVEGAESAGATSRSALYPTPGVSQLANETTGIGRAHYAIGGREFAVIGTKFFEIGLTGTLTQRGTVAIDANPATISANGDSGGELFVTSGGNGYIYNLASNLLSQIAQLNGTATMGDMLDGFFLCLDAATSTLQISNLLDGTTWQPSQIARRNLAPDRWVAMKVLGRYIWLLGQQTTEVWYNSGASPFPFAPYSVGVIPHGIAAPFSATIVGPTICWLQASHFGAAKVMQATGFAPNEVSTIPLQIAINGYNNIADAVGDCYTDLGHTFFLLSFVNADITWTLDTGTGVWSQRGTWIPENNAFAAWRPRYHAYIFNQHRLLDATSGVVYVMSSSIATDSGGRLIRRVRRAPGLMNEMQRVFYSSFELDLEPGLGLSAGQGSQPQACLRMSNDGGKTWGSEIWRNAGPLGEFQHRVRWTRCGAARRRVFEVSLSDPVPWRLTNAYLMTSGAPPSQPAQRTQ